MFKCLVCIILIADVQKLPACLVFNERNKIIKLRGHGERVRE